jgi:transposase
MKKKIWVISADWRIVIADSYSVGYKCKEKYYFKRELKESFNIIKRLFAKYK